MANTTKHVWWCNNIFPLQRLTVGGPMRWWDLEDNITVDSAHLRHGGGSYGVLPSQALGMGCQITGTSCVAMCWYRIVFRTGTTCILCCQKAKTRLICWQNCKFVSSSFMMPCVATSWTCPQPSDRCFLSCAVCLDVITSWCMLWLLSCSHPDHILIDHTAPIMMLLWCDFLCFHGF